MKKLVLLIILGCSLNLNINSLQAQSIISPIEVDLGIINLDLQAKDIMLVNTTTNEVTNFSSVSDCLVALPNLESGVYKLEYTIEENRYKIKLNTNKSNQD
jgi:hypothetical protein